MPSVLAPAHRALRFISLIASCLLLAALRVPPANAQTTLIPLAATAAPLYSAGPDWGFSARVADVANWSTGDRGQVHLWAWRGDNNPANQRWTLQPTADSSHDYEIINANSGLCLDKSMDNGNVDGAVVYQYHCTGSANQLWQMPAHPIAGSHIVSAADGRCLDVRNVSWSDGAQLQVWGCGNGWNQSWSTVNCTFLDTCKDTDFADLTLTYPGIDGPITGANEYAVLIWALAEQGRVNWGNITPGNPLNTTQTEPCSYSINSVGVKAYQACQGYTHWYWGITGTGDTLINGYYPGIISALRSPNSTNHNQCVALANAVGASPWGTGNFSGDCTSAPL